MPKGGKRTGAGRRKLKPELPQGAPVKNLASKILDSLGKDNGHKGPAPVKGHDPECSCVKCLCACEECLWKRDAEFAGADGQAARKYLWDRRDGKAVTTVNHVHDKPIEMNVNLSMAELVRKVRQRKAEYERSR